MTIRLTEAEVEEQFQEADEEELKFDPNDGLDITWKYDARFSKGWRREIDLREGVYLEIDQTHSADRVLVNSPEQAASYIQCIFLISGKAQWTLTSNSSKISLTQNSGQYSLRSNGLFPQCIYDHPCGSDGQLWSSVCILIEPKILCSFTACSSEELPKHLQHLVRQTNQEVYMRSTDIQPAMMTVLHQILQCPYQGLIKRVYLESKAIELVALVLDHEVAIQAGETKKVTLKPEQIERIHYAKEILLRDLKNPPSLGELARQAGLNDFLLKRGFRQVFETTVFGELRAYRLDLAKQLLAEGDMTVAEVANTVGYASMSYFSTAFKRKLGLTPKAYQKACR